MGSTSLLHLIHPNEIDLNHTTPLGDTRARNVLKGTWRGRIIAMKKLTREVSDDLLAAHAMKWRECIHPNVAGVLGISDPSSDYPFVISLCQSNGNVKQYIAKKPKVDRRKLVLETALGMQYLHSKGLIHGGLKPTNILVTDDEQACVTDFEIYKIQPSQNSEVHRYFSPEAWKGTVSYPSDVYAWAMCALEIFTSIPPWGVLSEKHIYSLVVYEDSRPDRPEGDLTDGIWSIIEESWHKDARYRPTFDIIIRLWREATMQEAARAQIAHARSLNTRSIDVAGNVPPTPPASSSFHQRVESFASSVSSVFPTGPPAYEAESSTAKHTSALRPAGDLEVVHGTFTGGPSYETTFDTQAPRANNLSSPIYAHDTYSFNATLPSHEIRSPLRTSRSLPVSPLAPVPRLIGRTPTTRSVRISSINNAGGTLQHARISEYQERPSALSNFTSDFSAALPVRTDQSVVDSRSVLRANLNQHQRNSSLPTPTVSDSMSIRTKSDFSGQSNGQSSSSGRSSPILLVGALQAELNGGRNSAAIDLCVSRIYNTASESDKEAHKLVTAGAVPVLIHLLKTRAVDMQGLEIVLITLGTLAFDTLSANAIYRSNTAVTLIELCKTTYSEEISTLSVWCLNRICRSADVANGLIKQKLVPVLLQQGATGHTILPSMSLYCLGILVQNDALAELLASMDVITFICNHLRQCTDSPHSSSEDICAALYAIGRMSRSIKLAKALAKAGCVDLVSHHLHFSDDPDILHWSARAVGCLMRPNSSDMAKILLDADIARGLARLPTVLSPGDLHPLGSLGFAVQRFSCAEWSGKIRLTLVEAGVVDSLLAALRTAADEPCYDVHIELALAVSLLGDVGGSAIRKEIVNAGGIDILKSVGSQGNSDVAKACNMAITSITGNLWKRNAASAKTAMAHNWSGGCPDYQPACPLVLTMN